MTIFVFFIAFCFIWFVIQLSFKQRGNQSFISAYKWDRLFYILGVSVFLFTIIGCRDASIGRDTRGYILTFLSTSLKVPSNILMIYKEPLFMLFNIIIRHFTDNYTVFLCIAAFFFVFSTGILIYRYSKSPLISYIVLLSLGYVYFSMAAIRQVIAISILLWAYKYVRERKLIPFLLLIALAYGFHNTSIVFLIAYPIANMKVTYKNFLALGVSYWLMMWGKSYVQRILFSVLNWERLRSYETNQSSISLSGALIQIVIIVFCMCFYKNNVIENPRDNSLYNMAFLGCFFQILTPYIGEFFRISIYFSVFNVILIANTCDASKYLRNRVIIKISVVAVLLIYFLFFSGPDAMIVPYKFAM